MDNTRKELVFNLALELATKTKDFPKNQHASKLNWDQWHKDVDYTWFNVLKLKANSDEEDLFTETIRKQLKIINDFKGE